MALFAAAFLAGSAAAAEARADACKLIQFASVDMANGNDPRVFVTATIGDEQRLFLIDSGAPVSTIEPDLVEKFHMITRELRNFHLVNSTGKNMRDLATIPSLIVGGMRFESVRAFVDPQQERDPVYGGALGADLLLHIDVEFDFAQHKVNFFSQDHCPGKAVYWPASKIVAIPMKIERSGYPILSVALNGHAINALLDTGSTNTLLELNTATRDFGFSPDAASVTKVTGNEAEGILYQQTFDSIDMNGIKISNVPILIHRDMAAEKMESERYLDSRTGFGITPQESNGVAPLVLGMREMRNLHLYFAYKEKTLYVTPNESQAAPVTH